MLKNQGVRVMEDKTNTNVPYIVYESEAFPASKVIRK